MKRNVCIPVSLKLHVFHDRIIALHDIVFIFIETVCSDKVAVWWELRRWQVFWSWTQPVLQRPVFSRLHWKRCRPMQCRTQKRFILTHTCRYPKLQDLKTVYISQNCHEIGKDFIAEILDELKLSKFELLACELNLGFFIAKTLFPHEFYERSSDEHPTKFMHNKTLIL